jgi:Zn-dependent M28 family amino/carboxypeptidase
MQGNIDQIHIDVDFLSKINPPRSSKNIESLEKVASYIETEFSKLDCVIDNQYFTVEDFEYRNVIATFNPGKKKRLIVGAHYDVSGENPGADDNATGVAGLLGCARLINEQKPEFDYRIDFIAYTLEEPPYFGSSKMGSAVHAKSMFDSRVKILGMICLDMIGFFSDEPGSQGYPYEEMRNVYPDKGNFVIVAGKDSQEKFADQITNSFLQHSGIKAFAITDPRLNSLLSISDHMNYWKYGFRAVMITDTAYERNPNYHAKTDTIDTLDFVKMAEVIKGCYHAIISF